MARSKRLFWTHGMILILILAVLGGCKQKKETAGPKAQAPLVMITHAERKTVPLWLKYIGTTAAVKSVDIRARVEGFLMKRNFKEGTVVKKDDLIYVIDPRPYQAELERNLAQLAKDEAALAFAREQVRRYKGLAEEDFVAREKLDDFRSQEKQAAAALEADRAAIKQARLDLGYCTIRAPLEGCIGRTLVHVGNLVGAGERTKLATIVKLDPIYVYFSPSVEDLLKIFRHKQEGALPVKLAFSDGEPYPHQGKVDFIDNTADKNTSTITVRAVFPNPDGRLRPGMYMNVSLFVTEIPDTVLVPQKAVGEDQGGTYVYLVGPDNKVEERQVTTGFVFEGRQVIWKGLKAGERVIVEGLQTVRPGIAVRTEEASGQNPKKEKKVNPGQVTQTGADAKK